MSYIKGSDDKLTDLYCNQMFIDMELIVLLRVIKRFNEYKNHKIN